MDITNLLLINGADINIKDANKNVPLHYAVFNSTLYINLKIINYTLFKKILRSLISYLDKMTLKLTLKMIKTIRQRTLTKAMRLRTYLPNIKANSNILLNKILFNLKIKYLANLFCPVPS